MNAEHLILETVFNDMLPTTSPYPGNYANVIAGLCKAKKGTYPPALAEIVTFSLLVWAWTSNHCFRGMLIELFKVYLKDAAADRLSEWMDGN